MRMNRLGILLVFNYIVAFDQYVLSGGASSVVVNQYQNMLHIKSNQTLSVTEQPKYSELSYISDTTANDLLLVLKPETSYRVTQKKQHIYIDVLPISEEFSRFRILLDPGHGGKDPGAIAKSGLKEKDVALSFAKHLEEKLAQKNLLEVSLIRSTDLTVDKYKRLEQILNDNPDYLVSLHADAYTNSEASGFGVFCLDQSQGSEKSQNILAAHGALNASASMRDEAINIGRFILNELSNKYLLHAAMPGLQPLVVLRSPKTPSILLELGFLSNPKEADLLSNDTYLETLASDVSLALSSYIYQKNAIIAAGLVN